MEIPVGVRVAVTAGVGRVRWTGVNPAFAAGKWVGVELDKPGGRNDGSVNGESYFSCKDKHGVFVRPSQVKLLDDAEPSGSSTSMPPPPVPAQRAQPSTPPRVTSSASNRSVAPSPSASRRPSTTTSAVRPGPTPTTGLTRSAQASRTLTRTVSTASNISVAADSRSVASPEPIKSLRAPTPSRSIPAARSISESSTATPVIAQVQPTVSAPAPDPAPAPAPLDGPTKRELDELRIKLRIFESRKVEDQERIKHLESKASENEAMRAARGKLQTKFQDLQTGLVAAQRAAKDLQSENTHLESRLTDLLEQLEMATLDREMAEEKVEMGVADALKMEERLAELEVEVAVLREENAEYDRPPAESDGERSSLAFIQLEKHNERLKDALIRLRDVSSEAEKEHRSRIAELEKDLSSTGDLSSRNELVEAKLANAESQIEDLKLQLDDALGAEDMLEQLTERNLQMGERIEEMRIAIEDLEALKELNDELEEGHVETEKQLAEEVASLEISIREERARSEVLAESMLDMEQTITQFRDLVSNLQTELDDVRTKHESHVSSSAENSKESHAVMNLNLKLQSTAVKAQSKTIELELKRLEAAQLAEHLRIVQSYLPSAYHDTESDSASALLFFQRLAFKANLLVTVISQLHALPLALHDASAEALVGICELRGKLGHFAALNRRFACILRHASADDWLGFATVLAELGAVNVEKRVDGWLELLRNDEFKEGDCARDLGSLLSQFEHLAETAFDNPEFDLGERQLDLALSFDYDLDNFAAAVGFARQAVKSYASEDDVEVITDDSSLEEGIYTPVQGILDQVRSIKGPSTKLVAILEDLTADSSALADEMLAPLHELSTAVSNAVDIAVQLAQRIAAHITHIRTSKLPLNLLDIDRFLVEITMDIVGETETPPWDIISQFVSRLSADLGHVLPKVKSAAKTGALVKLINPPPWVSRSESIKAAAAQNPEAERKNIKMSEEIRELMREVKIRDQGLQEAGVKAETLERRLEAMRRQTDAIAELENDVAKSKKQEKVYEDALEQLQAELDSLETENATLRKTQGSHGTDKSTPITTIPGATEPVALGQAGLETAQLLEQIESLRSALRYIRSENALLQSKDLYGDLLQLPALPHQHDVMTLPELDPSSPSSPTSSESDFTLRTPPSRRSLETESRILFREVAAFQASPKIVNLASLGKPGKWQSRKKSPEQQSWEWQKQQIRLQRKVGSLAERAQGIRT